MTKSELLSQMQDVFRSILDNGNVTLRECTTADDVDGWDSLTHIQIIVAIEKKFKIKFSSKEILSWKNAGEMADCILKK